LGHGGRRPPRRSLRLHHQLPAGIDRQAMTRIPAHRNDIATVLLGAATQPPWSNLGCWPADAAAGNRSGGRDARHDSSGDSEYDQACRRLALRHAEAVSLH
ncbi:hypothetical protein ABTE60_19750, partial [Acinetobacter baumannii]